MIVKQFFFCVFGSAGGLMFNVNLDILCQVFCSLLSPSSVVKFRSQFINRTVSGDWGDFYTQSS